MGETNQTESKQTSSQNNKQKARRTTTGLDAAADMGSERNRKHRLPRGLSPPYSLLYLGESGVYIIPPSMRPYSSIPLRLAGNERGKRTADKGKQGHENKNHTRTKRENHNVARGAKRSRYLQ